jgi:hypothetical protein
MSGDIGGVRDSVDVVAASYTEVAQGVAEAGTNIDESADHFNKAAELLGGVIKHFVAGMDGMEAALVSLARPAELTDEAVVSLDQILGTSSHKQTVMEPVTSANQAVGNLAEGLETDDSTFRGASQLELGIIQATLAELIANAKRRQAKISEAAQLVAAAEEATRGYGQTR